VASGAGLSLMQSTGEGVVGGDRWSVGVGEKKRVVPGPCRMGVGVARGEGGEGREEEAVGEGWRERGVVGVAEPVAVRGGRRPLGEGEEMSHPLPPASPEALVAGDVHGAAAVVAESVEEEAWVGLSAVAVLGRAVGGPVVMGEAVHPSMVGVVQREMTQTLADVGKSVGSFSWVTMGRRQGSHPPAATCTLVMVSVRPFSQGITGRWPVLEGSQQPAAHSFCRATFVRPRGAAQLAPTAVPREPCA
jgi:hypothetical protein